MRRPAPKARRKTTAPPTKTTPALKSGPAFLRTPPAATFDLWRTSLAPPADDKKARQAALKAKVEARIDGELRPRATTTTPKAGQVRGPRSGRRAVELPHAGTSYNPEEADRKDARDSVVAQLQRVINRDRKWSRCIDPDPETLAALANEKQWADEGWSENELQSEVIEFRKRPRKPLVERHRKKKARMREAAERRRLQRRRFNAQLDRVDIIAEQLAEKKAVDEALTKLKAHAKAVLAPVKIRRMGGARFCPKPLPVLCDDDVKKNLRRQDMAVAGTNPLQERYDSFLARNILPVHKRKREHAYRGPRMKPYYVYA